MADRNSAEIFGKVFERIERARKLSKNPEEFVALSEEIWPLRMRYDFSDSQMEMDHRLVELGLAKEIPDPDDSRYKMTVYKQKDGTFE